MEFRNDTENQSLQLSVSEERRRPTDEHCNASGRLPPKSPGAVDEPENRR